VSFRYNTTSAYSQNIVSLRGRGIGLKKKSLPYRSYSDYLQEKFGTRVHKITVDAGFTCPNRDGSQAYGGCTYCDNASFSPQVRYDETESVENQLKKGIQYVGNLTGVSQFIAYFQAFTNTYATPIRLKQIYDQCLMPSIVGLAIGTRPDCLSREIVEVLDRYTQYFPVWLELGLQTIHEETHRKTNRWQKTEDFYRALDLLAHTSLEVSVHLILGLPGETWEMMMETATAVTNEPLIQGAKIHHLYVSPHSIMEKQWKDGKIKLFSLEEYVSLLVDFMERLPPHLVIERLMGELSKKYALAPQWGLSKAQILVKIVEEFQRRQSYQGFRVTSPLPAPQAVSPTKILS
jgi:radical SAM protein (TIGR01212 family)